MADGERQPKFNPPEELPTEKELAQEELGVVRSKPIRRPLTLEDIEEIAKNSGITSFGVILRRLYDQEVVSANTPKPS